jgi:hypothetical protein
MQAVSTELPLLFLIVLVLVSNIFISTTHYVDANNNDSSTTSTNVDKVIGIKTKCGNKICDSSFEYCCNRSCGICAPINGGFCHKRFCTKPIHVTPRRRPKIAPKRTLMAAPPIQLESPCINPIGRRKSNM